MICLIYFLALYGASNWNGNIRLQGLRGAGRESKPFGSLFRVSMEEEKQSEAGKLNTRNHKNQSRTVRCQKEFQDEHEDFIDKNVTEAETGRREEEKKLRNSIRQAVGVWIFQLEIVNGRMSSSHVQHDNLSSSASREETASTTKASKQKNYG
jgi:hypothetical protein